MEKQSMFLSDETTMPYELPNSFFNPSWDNNNPMDHRDYLLAANNDTTNGNFVLRELIGRLGEINTNNTVSMVDHHQNQIPLPQFSTHPAFRAAKLSGFANGPPEPELHHGMVPNLESGKLSRVSSTHSFKASGSHQENPELGDSRETSSVSEQIPGGETGPNGAHSRKRKAAPKEKGKQTTNVLAENKESNSKRNKQEEEPVKDYIHVRARRGQATDAHSLAERVRREKISERMKFLQDLVPGCDKVTGKAVMLDEIINYVQSLQRQVEFLSMKLATVNPAMDSNMSALLSKDIILQSRGSLHHNMFPSDASYGQNLHSSMALPPMRTFVQNPSQVSTFFENDLSNVVQMCIDQNQTENLHGNMATAAQMKVEL